TTGTALPFRYKSPFIGFVSVTYSSSMLALLSKLSRGTPPTIGPTSPLPSASDRVIFGLPEVLNVIDPPSRATIPLSTVTSGASLTGVASTVKLLPAPSNPGVTAADPSDTENAKPRLGERNCSPPSWR